MIRTFLGQQGALVPASGRNIEVYEAVEAKLGADVLYSSTVVQSLRTSIGVSLWVQNAVTKQYTLVIAKKLLLAIEPTAANMAPFDMDARERDVFAKLTPTQIHAGLVSHPSLPVGGSLINTPAASSPNNWMVLPNLPGINSRFDWAADGLWRVLLVGDENFSEAEAKAMLQRDFDTLVAAGTIPAPAAGVTLEIKAWENHGPMHMQATADEIRAGFIQKQYALQGRRSTYFTGGAWCVQFQAILWAFDDILLEMMDQE